MQVHIFSDMAPARLAAHDDAPDVMRRLAEGTQTDNLVVAVYLMARRLGWEAHAMIDEMPRRRFCPSRGRWAFTRRFGRPDDVPERFHIIRMCFGMRRRYPAKFDDIHGWRLRCADFNAHLAYTFAHELHHHRRYSLGLHPGEGEQGACRWAVAHAKVLGFHLEGKRLARPKRRPKRSTVAGTPHFERLRALPEGAPLLILRDNNGSRYIGQTAVKVRALRRNSTRMAVRTPDGREWHWPMQWLADPREKVEKSEKDKKSKKRWQGLLWRVDTGYHDGRHGY